MCAAVNPRVNLKLLVMVGQKFVMFGQEIVMVGKMPAHVPILVGPCSTNNIAFRKTMKNLKFTKHEQFYTLCKSEVHPKSDHIGKPYIWAHEKIVGILN